MGRIRKITRLGLLTGIALTIFLLEAQLPLPIPVPGVKLGLSNIVTVFTVVQMGAGAGCILLAARIFLGSVFAGNFGSILYSAAGGALAIAVTVPLTKILKKNQLWVAGCLGSVAHGVGQMAAAVVLTGTPSILVYLPIMTSIGVITGFFTGLCAQLLINKGEKLWKTTFK